MKSPDEIEGIMAEIERTRAKNNKWFMKAWRLLFKVAPNEAAEIQRQIRKGDLYISELNGKLCE